MPWAPRFGTFGPTRWCVDLYAACWRVRHVKRSASVANGGGLHWWGHAPCVTATTCGATWPSQSERRPKYTPRMSCCASRLTFSFCFISNSSGESSNILKNLTLKHTPWHHLYGSWAVQGRSYVCQAHNVRRFFKAILVLPLRSLPAWCSPVAAASRDFLRPTTARLLCQRLCAWADRGSSGLRPNWRSILPVECSPCRPLPRLAHRTFSAPPSRAYP